MIVSHRHRFIYLRTEKTGGTSLTKALAALVEGDGMVSTLKRPPWAKWSPIHHGALKRTFPTVFGPHPHATAKQARAVLGRRTFDDYFKFAVERNPWDRQVSLYFHREWKKKNARPDFDRDMRSLRYRMTEHCRLRNWDVYAIDGTVVADRVLRYERLDEELASLADELGLPSLDLPRLRAEYRTERPHYSTYYSAETRDRVGRWYAREIEALGYRFEGEPAVAPPGSALATTS